MSCRCCGYDTARNSTVLLAQNDRNNNNDCFWPAFANLPRSTPSACCNSGRNSYNSRYSNESCENGGNSRNCRCSNGACNDRNNNNGCGRCRCGR